MLMFSLLKNAKMVLPGKCCENLEKTFKMPGILSLKITGHPVILLPIISKIFESFINDSLTKHFDITGLFSDLQYGFMLSSPLLRSRQVLSEHTVESPKFHQSSFLQYMVALWNFITNACFPPDYNLPAFKGGVICIKKSICKYVQKFMIVYESA